MDGKLAGFFPEKDRAARQQLRKAGSCPSGPLLAGKRNCVGGVKGR